MSLKEEVILMSTEYQVQDYGCEEFSQCLDLTSDVFNLLRQGGRLYLINLPLVFHEFHRACRMSRRLIKNIRSAIAFEDPDHLKMHYELFKGIRDRYIRMSDQISDSGLLSFFFENGTEEMLDEWDELVEDCYIGSDKEIRELIQLIKDDINVTHQNI
ncbi:hypothetical protein QUF72_22695 [Desulfobacterales bacterium HSG2]|nr:hypothetical protein [Desulfobacterales bacterium HSG2]